MHLPGDVVTGTVVVVRADNGSAKPVTRLHFDAVVDVRGHSTNELYGFHVEHRPVETRDPTTGRLKSTMPFSFGLPKDARLTFQGALFHTGWLLRALVHVDGREQEVTVPVVVVPAPSRARVAQIATASTVPVLPRVGHLMDFATGVVFLFVLPAVLFGVPIFLVVGSEDAGPGVLPLLGAFLAVLVGVPLGALVVRYVERRSRFETAPWASDAGAPFAFSVVVGKPVRAPIPKSAHVVCRTVETATLFRKHETENTAESFTHVHGEWKVPATVEHFGVDGVRYSGTIVLPAGTPPTMKLSIPANDESPLSAVGRIATTFTLHIDRQGGEERLSKELLVRQGSNVPRVGAVDQTRSGGAAVIDLMGSSASREVSSRPTVGECPRCTGQALSSTTGHGERDCMRCKGTLLSADAFSAIVLEPLAFAKADLDELVSLTAAKSPLTCAGCGAQMRSLVVKGVTVDVCTACGTCWLDADERGALRARTSTMEMQDTAT